MQLTNEGLGFSYVNPNTMDTSFSCPECVGLMGTSVSSGTLTVSIDELDSYLDKEGEKVNMETTELKEYKKSVINEIKGYKPDFLIKLDKQRKEEIEAIEKTTEISKLIEKHQDELAKEIRELFKDKRLVECLYVENGVGWYQHPVIKLHSYLTDKESEKIKSVEKKYKQYKDNVEVYFDLLVKSIELCSTEIQIQEFLIRKGFTDTEGMYVSCRKYCDEHLEEIKNFE